MSFDGGRRASKLVGGIFIAALVAVGASLVMKIALVQLGPAPPGAGEPAPDFQAPRLDGSGTVRLSALRGQVVLLDFFSPSCVGCVGATPKLNRLYERYKAEGFTIVSMSQVEESEAELLAFVARRQVRYPVVVDVEGKVTDAYGVYATPTVVLLDADGQIRAVHRGNVTETRLQTEIEALLRPRA